MLSAHRTKRPLDAHRPPDDSPLSKRQKVDADPAPAHFDLSSLLRPWGLVASGLDAFRNVIHQATAPSAPAHTPALLSNGAHPPTVSSKQPRPRAVSGTTPASHTSSAFSHLSDPQFREKYRTVAEDWKWATMRARGQGKLEPDKPDELIALEEERRQRHAQRAQRRAVSASSGTSNGFNAAMAQLSVGGEGTAASEYRRKKPMGSDKNCHNLVSSHLPVGPLDFSLDALPNPSLRPSQPPASFPPASFRSPSPTVPGPSMTPSVPWAPAYDPATFSPPPSPRLRPKPAPIDIDAYTRSLSRAALSPRSDTASSATLTSPTATISKPSSRATSSRVASNAQLHANLQKRDTATFHALRQGAQPIATSSGFELGSSDVDGGEAHPEADEDDFYGAIRGRCVNAERAKEEEDYEVYKRQVNAQAEREERKQHVNPVKISTAHSRARRTVRSLASTSSLIDHDALLASLGSTLHLRPSSSSRIPAPAQALLRRGKSDAVDRALRFAKDSMGEPTEEEKVARRKLRELKRLKEEEERLAAELDGARPKRRVFPEDVLPEQKSLVSAALKNKSFASTIPGAEVRGNDIWRLKPGEWLNDSIIDFIGILINLRSKAADDKGDRGEGERRLRKVHCFGQNFYKMFTESGFDKVKRWTRKFDTFDKDIIIVPINQGGNHWVCAAVNIADKRIEYYDSLGRARDSVYVNLRKWVEQEHQNRKKEPIDLSSWENYWDDDRPQQGNAFDCGVFTCMFMESLSRDVEGFDFSQKNMPYLRKKLVLMIKEQSLLDDVEQWE
ncbi:hypothetical protein JCM10207_004714 [Rhodosporidiobolus poonsookiae]